MLAFDDEDPVAGTGVKVKVIRDDFREAGIALGVKVRARGVPSVYPEMQADHGVSSCRSSTADVMACSASTPSFVPPYAPVTAHLSF